MSPPTTHQRTVFFVSDGTGITAETFGNAILNQFELNVRHIRLPFVNSMEKAQAAVQQINHVAESEGQRPIVFSTLVHEARLDLARRLLTNPRHDATPISDVAMSVGFGDLSHFNRSFRRRFGMTPREARGEGVTSQRLRSH